MNAPYLHMAKLTAMLVIMTSSCTMVDETQVTVRSVALVGHEDLPNLIPTNELIYPRFSGGGNEFLLVEFVIDRSSSGKRYLAGDGFLHANAFLCDRPESTTMLSILSVYSRGRNISRPPVSGELPVNTEYEDIDSHPFYFFLLPKLDSDIEISPGRADKYKQKYYERFDLEKTPMDVCFNLRIGREILRVRKTRPVIISSEEISSAFERYRSRRTVQE